MRKLFVDFLASERGVYGVFDGLWASLRISLVVLITVFVAESHYIATLLSLLNG